MKEIPKIPDGELEVMMVVWEAKEGVTSDYILEKLEGKKTWGRTTVLKFLSRLTERGFLEFKKQGKFNVYSPLIEEKEYLQKESKSFLEKMYNNSVKNLVATLYNSKSISEEDFAELKKFIEEAK